MGTSILLKHSRVNDEAFVANWFDYCHSAFQGTSRNTQSENHPTCPYHLHQPAPRPYCLHPPTLRPFCLPIKFPTTNLRHFPITYKRKISPKAPVVYKSQEDPGPPPVVPYNAAGNVCENDAGQIVPCAHGVAPGSPNFYIGCGQNVMSGSLEEEILKIHNKRRFDLQKGILSQVQQDLDDNRV